MTYRVPDRSDTPRLRWGTMRCLVRSYKFLHLGINVADLLMRLLSKLAANDTTSPATALIAELMAWMPHLI